MFYYGVFKNAGRMGGQRASALVNQFKEQSRASSFSSTRTKNNNRSDHHRTASQIQYVSTIHHDKHIHRRRETHALRCLRRIAQGPIRDGTRGYIDEIGIVVRQNRPIDDRCRLLRERHTIEFRRRVPRETRGIKVRRADIVSGTHDQSTLRFGIRDCDTGRQVDTTR